MMQPELSRRLAAAKDTPYIISKGIWWWHDFLVEVVKCETWEELPGHLKREILAAEKSSC